MKRNAFVTLIAIVTLAFVSQILPVIAQELGGGGSRRLHNGDVNGDGVRDVSDVIFHLKHLFSGGPPPIEIPDDGEEPSTALLADIQASAERILGKLPKPEELPRLPAPVKRYLTFYQKLVSSAAASAPSWTAPQAHRFVAALNAVVMAWPLYQAILCQVYPERCVDWDCLERCHDHLEVCMNGCQGKSGFEFLQCNLDCNAALAECLLDCN